MRKPANKPRGEVAVPEFGSGVFIRFTVDSLERLETELGEKYFDDIMEGLADFRIKTMKLLLEVSIVGDREIDWTVFGGNLDAVRAKLYDAIFLMVYGKTFEEKKAEEEAALKKELENIAENPQLAAALLSRLQSVSGIEPASDPTSSAASPPSRSESTPAQ